MQDLCTATVSGAQRSSHPGYNERVEEDVPAYRQRTSINAALAERYILELGLQMIDRPEIIQELADEAARGRLALDANAPTREAIERELAKIEQERKAALEQNRRGWLPDEELAEVMEDIAARRIEHERELERLDAPLAVEDLRNEALKFLVGPESVPGWWEEHYEPPQPGVISPGDPEWEAVVAGLRDEVKGIAPDQDPDELSEWARSSWSTSSLRSTSPWLFKTTTPRREPCWTTRGRDLPEGVVGGVSGRVYT